MVVVVGGVVVGGGGCEWCHKRGDVGRGSERGRLGAEGERALGWRGCGGGEGGTDLLCTF